MGYLQKVKDALSGKDKVCLVDELTEIISVASDPTMRDHWDSVESYFLMVDDPLELGISYKITECKIEVTFESVKLILLINNYPKIYCSLPHDEPADINRIIGAFKHHPLIKEIIEHGSPL